MNHRPFGLGCLLGHRRRNGRRLQRLRSIRRAWRNRGRLRRRPLRIEFVRQGASAAEQVSSVPVKVHDVQAPRPLANAILQETLIRRIGSRVSQAAEGPERALPGAPPRLENSNLPGRGLYCRNDPCTAALRCLIRLDPPVAADQEIKGSVLMVGTPSPSEPRPDVPAPTPDPVSPEPPPPGFPGKEEPVSIPPGSPDDAPMPGEPIGIPPTVPPEM
jgi:hypothetical protein